MDVTLILRLIQSCPVMATQVPFSYHEFPDLMFNLKHRSFSQSPRGLAHVA